MRSVSIPFRGFRCLQRNFSGKSKRPVSIVSIPFRGFRCLQLAQGIRQPQSVLTFQSLSGVLGVCNKPLAYRLGRSLHVSIPFRGFRCLQPTDGFAEQWARTKVSIPFRGFRCLQLRFRRPYQFVSTGGFNPFQGF